MSGWSAAKALTLFSPSHLDPQSEHCFAVSIQSTSQVSAAAVSSHSPVCGMCSGLLCGKRCNKKSVSLKACVDVWRAISSRRMQYAR